MKYYKTTMDKVSLIRTKSEIPRAKITCSKDAAKYARRFYHQDIDLYESFFIMMLNNANNTIGFVKISQGGVTGTVVDVKIVAKYALDTLCTGVIMVHNHPSGTLKESEADRHITEKCKKALNLIDVKLLDHLILVPTDRLDESEAITYISFADNSLL
jgi:DNA repair protein RadC